MLDKNGAGLYYDQITTYETILAQAINSLHMTPY
jgi:hypothetical protein